MKNFQYSTFIIFLFLSSIFLGISCKKDTPAPVKPEKGKWLLSKMYLTYPYGTGTAVTYLREEYIYNDQKRPWLDISYNSSHDTLKIDTLFYDDQSRLSQMGIVTFGYKSRSGYRVKKIHYATDGKIDTIKVFAPTAPYPLLNTSTYKYEGSLITQYVNSGPMQAPLIDSFRYTYDNDNLKEWRNFINPEYGNIPPEMYTYLQYDDCYNILSYLNMNVYLPSSDADCPCYKRQYVNEPLLSKNNYFMKEVQSLELQFDGLDLFKVYTYEYTKDSTGMIIGKIERSPTDGVATKYSYEYIPAN